MASATNKVGPEPFDKSEHNAQPVQESRFGMLLRIFRWKHYSHTKLEKERNAEARALQNRPFKFSFFAPRANSAESDARFEELGTVQNPAHSQVEVQHARSAASNDTLRYASSASLNGQGSSRALEKRVSTLLMRKSGNNYDRASVDYEMEQVLQDFGMTPIDSEQEDVQGSKVRRTLPQVHIPMTKGCFPWSKPRERYAKAEPFFDFKRRLINPKSTFMVQWDLNTTLLLIFTSLVTPYEVAFLGTDLFGVLFFINRWVDLCFMVDMVFNFFLPFADPSTGNIVTYHRLIWKRYMACWFWIDLVSILPFEMLSTFMGGASMLAGLKALRVIRLAKLAKLLRVVRGLRVFKRWEARMFINYALLNLFMLFCGICLGTHWLACAWAVLVDMEGEGWNASFPHLDDDSPAFSHFISCLYWSVGMVTSLGDPFAMTVTTDTQRVAFIVACLSAGIANAYLIGGVVSLLERMNERKSEFYRAMDILNEFLKERDLSSGRVFLSDGKEIAGAELCERLRTYYIFKHSQGSTSDNFHEILFTCSNFMQSAVATKMHADVLQRIPYFVDASKEFITLISCSIRSVIFAAQEKVFEKDDPVENLYIVERGCVFCKGQVIRQNCAFGEEVFYRYEPGSTWGYMAVTLTESVLQYVEKGVLKDAVERFGDWRMRIRMKVNSSVLKLARATKRAAVVAMKFKDFAEGYEVLLSEYSEELLQVQDSPIIETWRSQLDVLMNEMQADGKVIEVKLAEGSRFKRSSTVVLTIQQACDKYFDMLARRAAVRMKLLKDLDYHKAPMKDFLTSDLFDGYDMAKYHDKLMEQKLSVEMMLNLSPTDLSVIGIPLGDAIRICAGASIYCGKNADTSKLEHVPAILASGLYHAEPLSQHVPSEATPKRDSPEHEEAKKRASAQPGTKAFVLEQYVLDQCLAEGVNVAVVTGSDSKERQQGRKSQLDTLRNKKKERSTTELLTEMLSGPTLNHLPANHLESKSRLSEEATIVEMDSNGSLQPTTYIPVADALPSEQTSNTSAADEGPQHSSQTHVISTLSTQRADAVIPDKGVSEINAKQVPSSDPSESFLHEEAILGEPNSIESIQEAELRTFAKVPMVTVEEEEMVLGQAHSEAGLQGVANSHSETQTTSQVLTKLAKELDSGNEPPETTNQNPVVEPSDSTDDLVTMTMLPSTPMTLGSTSTKSQTPCSRGMQTSSIDSSPEIAVNLFSDAMSDPIETMHPADETKVKPTSSVDGVTNPTNATSKDVMGSPGACVESFLAPLPAGLERVWVNSLADNDIGGIK